MYFVAGKELEELADEANLKRVRKGRIFFFARQSASAIVAQVTLS